MVALSPDRVWARAEHLAEQRQAADRRLVDAQVELERRLGERRIAELRCETCDWPEEAFDHAAIHKWRLFYDGLAPGACAEVVS